MSGRRTVLVAATALLGVCSGSAVADEVFLRNGASIEGRVTESGDEVAVAVSGGTIRLQRREVERIERRALPEDLYAERAARTDFTDPVAIRALATYATGLGLKEVSKKLDAAAGDLELEQRVARLKPGDSAGLRAAAEFARERGMGRAVERYLYRRALAENPVDDDARRALGRLDNEERHEAEEARRRAEAAEREAFERAAEEARAEAARLRAEVERQRERVVAAQRARDWAEQRAPEAEASAGPRIVIIPGGGRRVRTHPAPGPVPAPVRPSPPRIRP